MKQSRLVIHTCVGKKLPLGQRALFSPSRPPPPFPTAAGGPWPPADLHLRSQQLSRALGTAFFDRDAAAARSPFGGARFPGLYVCTELPPLWPALQAVQRALLQVAVKGAGDGPCDWYYDNVGELMRLLVGDAEAGRGAAVFDRNKFEAAFALEWAE